MPTAPLRRRAGAVQRRRPRAPRAPALVGQARRGAARAHRGRPLPASRRSPSPCCRACCAARRWTSWCRKSTELGVARIRPLIAGRGSVRLEGERLARRLAHWRAVAVAACEQCGRARIPAVDAPICRSRSSPATPLPEARWVLDPEGLPRRRRGRLRPPAALAIAVGPEGGF
ncbi:MAG: RsmE family RNA methyltransferase [Xanthomonadales bacterium]|nr:RsmE family RNA methyltransferase [Xanthomonadales bacterium]